MFADYLVYFSPVLVCCIKKNLATLILAKSKKMVEKKTRTWKEGKD
jgi:hypothetical protein